MKQFFEWLFNASTHDIWTATLCIFIVCILLAIYLWRF